MDGKLKGTPAWLVMLVCALLLAYPAEAQVQRGVVYGTVSDTSGAVLPGSTLELTSDLTAPKTIIAGPQGEFRFQDLDPGTYTLKITMDGFTPFTQENLIVGVGTSVELPIQLAVAGVAEEVTVASTSPVIDPRAQGNSTNFNQASLNEIPTARDPWVLMQQIPGVLVDRVNVGGSESGQQSVISARGDDGTNTMWNIDGVTITDAAAIGSSSTYYDFNAFEEAQFTTGGADPRQLTGGLGINFVTKRGTNLFHGTGRIYYTDDALQGSNVPPELEAVGFPGNRIKQIAEFGGDIGGPIVRDRLWFWGAAAKNDIRQLAITGAPDNTELENWSAKLNAQISENNTFNFFYYRGNKEKLGRNAGVTRPPETTWDQTGPTDIYKFEDSHTFGTNWFLSGKFAYVSGGFSLTPQSGLDSQTFNDFGAGGVWHGGYLFVDSDRPQYQTNVDSSYFRGNHEFKMGFQYRRTPVTSISRWPGNNTYAIVNLTALGYPAGVGWIDMIRAGGAGSVTRSSATYFADVITTGNWTFNLGLRYDHQNGTNEPAQIAANGLAPDIVPGLDYPGGGPDYTWKDLSPRIGMSRRLGEKTIVRANYARFAEQLRSAYLTFNNPSAIAGIEYYFFDANRDNLASRAEITNCLAPFCGFTGSAYNIDVGNPDSINSPNRADPDLDSPITHAIVAGVDHELMPNFSVGTAFGWGYITNTIWQPYVGLELSDFEQYRTAGTASGVTSDTPVFRLKPGVSLPKGNAQITTNRDGYHQRYYSLDFTANKRLSNRWMFRGFLTFQNHQEYFDDPALSIQDPTPKTYNATGNGNDEVLGAYREGGIVVNVAGNTSGARGDVFLHSKWSYSLAGLYDIGWGINVAGSLYGRQGYPNPEFIPVNRGGLGSTTAVMVNNDLDAVRHDSVHALDLRAQKKFVLRGDSSLIFDVDVFNVLNNDVIMQRNRQAGSSTFRQGREIMAPRILRFGLRYQF